MVLSISVSSSSILRRSKRRQPAELHVQDSVGLQLRESKATHQVGARRIDAFRPADGLDDLVHVVQGDLQPFQDVRPGLGFLEIELGAAADDGASEIDEVLDDRPEAQHAGLPVHQGKHVDKECGLHGGMFVERVEHLARLRIPPELEDDAHALAVRLVPQVADALDLLLPY